MTWKEFKDLVDEKLTNLQLSEDIELQYIDVSTLSNSQSVNVSLDKTANSPFVYIEDNF